MTGIEITIQALTCGALTGLLCAVGLRLTYGEVKNALNDCPLVAILLLNFIVVPALAVAAVRGFGLRSDVAVALVLLAASPFAPVVPVFARMARSALALAAVLTGLFPLACAFLTPFAARGALWILGSEYALSLNVWTTLATLAATVTLPLAVGMFVRYHAPDIGRRLLRPVELISEAVGATSLAFVTATQFHAIISLQWRSWLAMAAVSELSLLLGWWVGAPDRGTRQVVALGTSNRNIALALLVSIQSFHGTEIASAVVGNGLLLITFGLLHVAWWRFFGTEQRVSY